tara:strand:- start:342 stop:749 length:408 start_codon:yes stop_codon:yes gene_type:complete
MLPLETIHQIVGAIARLIEVGGVVVILCGIALSAVLFARDGRARDESGARDWRGAYVRLRSNLGRGILLGLELLVAADIIATITAPITPESILLLGAVVLIRTFLSFALETEIEGVWPWRRAALQERARGDTQQR